MASVRTAKDGFSALGLSDTLISTLTALGYEEPTPVQRETIPLMIDGRDLLAQAATGTGKTAAFALPIIQALADKSGKRQTCGIVLVPTRELAMQVSEAIHRYARGTGISVVPLYGGSSMQQQIRALERGTDVVVATPGRALDHIRRKTLKLGAVRILVLDEADEMLDMGFAEDIETIFQETPDTRQTALFSATMPARILKIAERHLKKPQRVTIAREKTAVGKLPRIRQVAYIIRRAEKPAALDRILEMEDPTSAIVFCRTRLEVDTLTETLNAHGYRAEALHGGMEQRQRDAVMNRVRSGKTDLLVATDVAARGLDIEQITHIVNYDVPAAPESYVHRIGRTGRAGRAGVAVTFVDWRDMHRWKLIDGALGLDMAEPVETYSTSEHLYTELDIPREATGTLPRTMRERAGLEAEAIEDIGETGRIRTPRRAPAGRGSGGRGSAGRGGRTRKSTGDGTAQAAGTAGRRRRRTRAGREIGTAESAGQGQAAPEQAAGQASEQAPRMRRRRRTSAGSGNQSEETRRKAS